MSPWSLILHAYSINIPIPEGEKAYVILTAANCRRNDKLAFSVDIFIGNIRCVMGINAYSTLDSHSCSEHNGEDARFYRFCHTAC